MVPSSALAEHEAWMEFALQEARAALERGDTPVGAIVVAEGNVVGRGQCRDQSTLDLTAVAELEALRAASPAIHTRRLRCRIYVTVEPCLLGLGAIFRAKVGTLVYGIPNGADGMVAALQESHLWPPGRPAVVGGVLADRSGALLEEYLERTPSGFVADWCRAVLDAAGP
jgi:tRNA(adenine34) deaminase